MRVAETLINPHELAITSMHQIGGSQEYEKSCELLGNIRDSLGKLMATRGSFKNGRVAHADTVLFPKRLTP